jgi:hypothetical protein
VHQRVRACVCAYHNELHLSHAYRHAEAAITVPGGHDIAANVGLARCGVVVGVADLVDDLRPG